MVAAVRAAGGKAKLTIYLNAGHEICRMTYATPELFAWLFAQRSER